MCKVDLKREVTASYGHYIIFSKPLYAQYARCIPKTIYIFW